ncbi:hypothetical protein [Parvularcula maris]|uniref:Lipoprotein n=1 Tax=Parvularcula maris TaxID=2965077 RepID=A0A9X2RGA9_9PROT|nr:hypothetical protein [Parvularcula maris]MCQ8183794.1 hypothetical protein [Parvularcula maris]
MREAKAVIGFLAASACQSAPEVLAPNDQAARLSGDGVYVAPLWLSEDFEGSHERSLSGGTLLLTMMQTAEEGGLDTAIARDDVPLVPVVEVADALSVCFSYDVQLEGEGRWWAGPKISVGWNTEAGEETAGWYETYVVETAAIPPDMLEGQLTSFFGAQFIGTTRHDGGVYRHFTFPFSEWQQFWAIRQDYRVQGETTLGPILNLWQDNGLPSEKRFDGVKVNIETYGPVTGTVLIEGRIPPSYAAPPELECAFP